MSKALLMITSLFIGIFAAVIFSQPAMAFEIWGGVDCKDAKNSHSSVCSTQAPGDDPLSGDNGLLIKIANIVAYIAGVAAVLIIIIGAIRYVTSNGDSNKISSAKSAVLGALIGLVLVLLARTIIYFVVNKL